MSTPSDTCSSSNDESGVPEVKCSVSNVTVFLDRSMITRKGTIALTKSTKRVHLSGFPVDDLDADTMRVGCEGTGALRILDFKLSKKTHTDIPDDVIANLEKKKLDLEDTLQDIQDKVDVVQHQIKFVEKIPADQKAEHGTLMRRVEPKEWKNLVEYMSDELNDLHARKRKLERSMRNLRLSLNAVSAELVRHQGARKRTRQRVTVDVCVDEDGEYEFDVSHLCYSARWHPTYDARVNSLNKSIELSYLGVVTQNTGEDWIDVQIMLSTASPHLGGTAPVLNAWYIKEYIPPPPVLPEMQVKRSMSKMKRACPKGVDPHCVGAMAPEEVNSKQAARYVEAEVQQGHGSNVVFRPSGQNSIPTGEEPTKLLIMRCEVGNEFNFITVPKRGEKVYLNAAVTNTSEYPLLSGPISLFLDNSFVGYASLSRMVLPSETFDLQLGVDESIRVVYKLKNKSSGERKGIFSKNKTEEYAYEILLESFRECDEVVIVRDQIPVSQDERIKVDVLEKIPSESEEKNEDDLQKGVVEWRVVLNARKKSRIQLAYRVSYPPEITVTGL